MAYRLTFTERFRKHFSKLNENEKKQIRKKLSILQENPIHPSLRTKRIQGTADLFECSVNMDIRVHMVLRGKHDERTGGYRPPRHSQPVLIKQS